MKLWSFSIKQYWTTKNIYPIIIVYGGDFKVQTLVKLLNLTKRMYFDIIGDDNI